LIAWSIQAALHARVLDTVVVTTDDEEIADVARRCGAHVPFMRPSALAQDDTSGIDPVLHALEQLPEFEAVLLLQPTSPLRTSDDINACVQLAQDLHAPSAVSVSEAEQHPNWMYRLGTDHRMHAVMDAPLISNRQDLPPVYALNGALYYARADWLWQHRAFVTGETVGYVMAPLRSIALDTLLDWKLADLLLKEQA
jgi:CMP-N,N'-diacetyllegionaminic acid synthase